MTITIHIHPKRGALMERTKNIQNDDDTVDDNHNDYDYSNDTCIYLKMIMTMIMAMMI